ncbi:h k ATPase alpha [Grosmannia clavigera kw1407]|uniref:H k ATPase alpha n=1 Tax=Grosmannia clavigera (strain kw1407 / UAMH 11150) TaxID=655863 RepID=F0XM89_GROCL|nr:h k ATPase alpha [Grosmannia clavigera kw1407]EFX01252.1 h k ATPase alpha [Grosmannia clavigera kw1407]
MESLGTSTDWIRFEARDEEAGPADGGRAWAELRRMGSSGSLSIRSHSRRTSIDAAALPMAVDEPGHRADKNKSTVTVTGETGPGCSPLAQLHWHRLAPNELAQQLTTSLKTGLSGAQAARRLQQYGPNVPSPPAAHRMRRLLGYFFSGFGPVLLVASVLAFVAWRPLGHPPQLANLALAIVLLGIFIVQASFNIWQDWSSARIMASIQALLPGCIVLRDGQPTDIAAADLVPGDVVLLRAGSRLPADVRFVKVANDTKLDRSVLTGESAAFAAAVDSSTLEREVFRFVAGICIIMITMILLLVIVWASWLRRRHPGWIDVSNLIISCVSVAVAFVPDGLPVAVAASMTISANMMRRNKILCKALKTVETLGCVSILCSDKTGTLTQNKMTVTECAVGGHAVLSADAARDTLQNWGHTSSLTADSADPGLLPGLPSVSASTLHQLRAVAGLCNDGQFDAATLDRPLAEQVIHGDATDQAILRFSESLGSVSDLRRCWSSKFALPFNSKNKYMIRALTLADNDGLSIALPPDIAAVFSPHDILITIKGAPDTLLPRVQHYVDPETGTILPFDDAARARVDATKDAWSGQGCRVILLARKIFSASALPQDLSTADFEAGMKRQCRDGLTLVGLVSLVDPPRPEAHNVVATLRRAGIRIFMITGDFALTAQAIAADCGIVTAPAEGSVHTAADLPREPDSGGPYPQLGRQPFQADPDRRTIVLSGPDLSELAPSQWDALARYEEVIFARTTPEQKLYIVHELQARAFIVAMTGDGANDAPSLRAADIGIAMGAGSDMAIEAADMVLLDNSFARIVEALRYSRMMFDNLKKSIAYLLPAGSFSEFWPILTNVVLGIPQILSSFLMIVICLFTDPATAIALAYEAPEADVLLRPSPVSLTVIVSSFTMSYWYLQRNGIPFFHAIWFRFGSLPDDIDPDYYAAKLNIASSIYFVNLVVMQWFSVLTVRTRRLSIFQHPPVFNKKTQNLYIFPAVLFVLVMVFVWLYVPEFHTVLGNEPVPVEYWFFPMAFGIGVLLLDEARFLARIAW